MVEFLMYSVFSYSTSSSHLLLALPHAALQEVAAQQAAEEHDVHGGHDGHAHAAHRVGHQGHVVPVQHQPACHPGQRVDAEHHVGAQVDDAVDLVGGARHQVSHAQHLPQVQEHRVDLHQEGHHGEAHEAAGQHRDAKARDHLDGVDRDREIETETEVG